MGRKKDIEVELNDVEEESASADTDRAEQAQEDQPTEAVESKPDDELSQEERLKKQIEELDDRLLRTVAEFDNYRKRQARQYQETVKAAGDRVLTDLLDIIDNLQRALEHADDKTDFESFRKGTELIFNQMQNILNKYEVEPIESVGKPFDPNLHEALMQVASDEYGEGVIAVEMTKGYKRGDRVLRHAKVGVSTGAPNNDEQA